MTNEKRNTYERLSRFIRKNRLLTSGNETSVWEFIFNGAFGKNGYNKDAQFIADRLGIGKRTVERAVSKMKRAGLIDVRRYKGTSGRFGNNTFTVLDPTAKSIKTNRQNQPPKMAGGETTQAPDTEGVKTMKEEQICTFSQTTDQPPKMAGQSKEPTLTGNYLSPEESKELAYTITGNQSGAREGFAGSSSEGDESDAQRQVREIEAAYAEVLEGKTYHFGHINEWVNKQKDMMEYKLGLIDDCRTRQGVEDFRHHALEYLTRKIVLNPHFKELTGPQKMMFINFEQRIDGYAATSLMRIERLEEARREAEEERQAERRKASSIGHAVDDETGEMLAEFNEAHQEDNRQVTQQDIAEAMSIVLKQYRNSIATGDGITSTELIDKFKTLYDGYDGPDKTDFGTAFNSLSGSRERKLHDKPQEIVRPASAFKDPNWKPTFDYGRFNDRSGTKNASISHRNAPSCPSNGSGGQL